MHLRSSQDSSSVRTERLRLLLSVARDQILVLRYCIHHKVNTISQPLKGRSVRERVRRLQVEADVLSENSLWPGFTTTPHLAIRAVRLASQPRALQR